MAERHVDTLFSTAYDGELDPAGRRRFDAHLDGCARCAEAFDHYRTALDAVRALPAVAMPATVRLPVGPPQAAPGRAAVLGRLRDALLHPPPVWAAAGLAAVGVAAVVLAVHHGGGTTSTSSPNLALSAPGGAADSQSQKHSSAFAPMPGTAPQALQAVTPCPVAQVAPGSNGASSAGFSHAARSSAGSGRELVLATSTDHYAPGADVPIYARLTGGSSSAGGTDVVPCVTLETDGGTGSGAAGAPAPQAASGAQAGNGAPVAAPPPATPIAVATAQPAQGAPAASSDRSLSGTAALLHLRIPTGVPPGSYRLVALIPAESSPTGAPLEVVLYITVR